MAIGIVFEERFAGMAWIARVKIKRKRWKMSSNFEFREWFLIFHILRFSYHSGSFLISWPMLDICIPIMKLYVNMPCKMLSVI